MSDKKSKAELHEMLAEAVRNTQPQPIRNTQPEPVRDTARRPQSFWWGGVLAALAGAVGLWPR
jgi:hypothetical protein